MGGIENFLSRLLKDKIPRYHGILPYSDFYILVSILLHFMSSWAYFLSNKLSGVSWLLEIVLKQYTCHLKPKTVLQYFRIIFSVTKIPWLHGTTGIFLNTICTPE